MGVGDDMNKEIKKQLILSFVLLTFVVMTLFFWYQNFIFHTYGEKIDYQYCLYAQNDEWQIEGYEFYKKGKTQGYGHARMTPLQPQLLKKNDEMTVTLHLKNHQPLVQTIKVQNENQVLFLENKTGQNIFSEKDLQNVQLQIEVKRQKKSIYNQTLSMQKQDMITYTSANKDYTLTNVYVTEHWLKTGSFSSKDTKLAKKYPYMIVDYMYSKEENQEVDINDYERFLYLKGKTEDFLNDHYKDHGFYDGEESLLDMQLCCVITLMKSEDDSQPYTFILPLNPIQKGDS